MKKLLILLLPLIVVFTGCQKDLATPDRTDTDMAANGRTENFVKNPLKVNFYAIPDLTMGFVECMPVEFGIKVAKKFNVGGTATHFGQIKLAESSTEHTMCYLGPQPFQLTALGNGVIVAANGDQGFFTSSTLTNAMDMTFTGTVTMTGGTGRFDGCTGEVIITGSQDITTLKVTWTGDGYIMMKKK